MELKEATHQPETDNRPTGEEFDAVEQYILDDTESDFEQLLETTKLERDSNPQTGWPEGNPDGTISEADYRRQLDWRLTSTAYLLDAVRANLDETNAQQWLTLKETCPTRNPNQMSAAR